MKRFLILGAVIMATINMQNVSAYNDFEKVDLSGYFISSELEGGYGCWQQDDTANGIQNMEKYSKIFDSVYKFCVGKTLGKLTEYKQSKGEYLLYASKDFIKNIENIELYKNFKAKNIQGFDGQSDLSIFFQKYLTYDTPDSINSKLKIKGTFIHPKGKTFVETFDGIVETNVDLKVIIVDDISLSKEKTKEELEEEKLQKGVKQVDNIILGLQKQLDSGKLKIGDLEKKVEKIISKINKLIEKTKNETKKQIYNYLIDQLNDLIFQNNEIIKIIPNNK